MTGAGECSLAPGADGALFSIYNSRPSLWLSADRNIGTVGARKWTASDKHRFQPGTSVKPGLSDFWLSFWVYRDAVTAAHGIFRTYENTRNFELYFPASATHLQFQFQATNYLSTLAGVAATTWTHVAVAFDRDGLATIYINGVVKDTKDISGSAAVNINGSLTTIGSLVSTSYLSGRLSRFGYGTGLITADDAVELYNQGNGKFYAELSAGLAAKVTHYWNLNEGSLDDPAYDACGTNDGALAYDELLSNTGFETAGTNGGVTHGVPVATRARSSNVATLTTSINHGLVNGNVVTIASMTDTSYNAAGVTVTRVDDTTFTYANTGSDEGGTADTAGRVATDVFANWSEWSAAAGTCTINRESSIKDAGSYSCRIDVDAANSLVYANQTVLTSGNSYTVSARARSSAASGKSMVISAGAELSCSLTDAFQTFSGTLAASSTNLSLVRSSAASSSIYIDTVSCKSAGIPPAAGPREATASDLISGYHGALTNMDTVNAWKTDTPDGSYTVTKEDSVGTVHGTMTGFADVDAAHVDGPDGHWGPYIQDRGSGGNDGWLVGGVADSRSLSVPGAAGVDASLRCNGTSQYVTKDNQDFAGAFTFAAWIYLDDLSANANIVGDTADANADGIRVDATTGHVSITVGGSNTVLTTTGLSATTWTHVAVTRDATTNALHVYVAGVEDTTGTPTQAGALGFNAIGATRSTPTAFFDGNIAGVKVYDSALSAANVALLATGSAVGSPVGDWRFDDVLSLPYLSGCKAIQSGASAGAINLGDAGEGTRDFTVCCWFKKRTPDAAANQYLFGRYNATDSKRAWAMRSDQTTGNYSVMLSADGVNPSIRYSGVPVCDGTWHHLAFVMNSGANPTLYVDGVDTGGTGTANPADVYDSSDPVGLLALAPLYVPSSESTVADARLYAAKLTQAQIRSLIAGTDYTTGMCNQWKFGETPRSIASCADGYSLEFDGTDDYVGETVNPSAGATNFSVSCWIKKSAYVQYQGIINFWAAASGDCSWLLGYENPENTISFFVRGASATLVATRAGLTAGAWHHICATFNGAAGTAVIYLNGVAGTAGVNATVTAANNVHGTAPYRGIGRYYEYEWNGKIDDLRVYNSTLSAADAALLAAGGEPSTTPVAHWSFDDGPQYGEPSDGDPITVWQDRGTSKINFTQATAGLRPTYDQDCVNGLPGIDFDGSTQYLGLSSAIFTGKLGNVFAVVLHDAVTSTVLGQSDEAGDTAYVQLGVAPTDYLAYSQNNGGTADSLVASTTVIGQAAARLLEWSSDGSTIYGRVDGVAQTLAAGSGANSGDWWGDVTGADNTTLGVIKRSSLGAYLNGKILELVVYDRPLSASDAARVRRILASKYNITLA